MFKTAATVIDATRAALANPEDTTQAFRIAEALSFNNPERLLRRFRADPTGARLLAERRDLLEILTDRERLEAMPADSLAAAYLAFLDSEGISAEGLVEASAVSSEATDGDVAFLRARMRDSHDLWHTVMGYQGDLLGESALLAFTFAQTGHPGVGFLAGLGFVLAPERAIRRVITDGFKRGRRAGWLVAADWAELLPMPIGEVRERLGVGAPPVYEPVRESRFAMA